MEKVRLINQGVDTLIVNGYHTSQSGYKVKRELDSSLDERLEEWKRAAQHQSDLYPVPLTFNGDRLHMCPNGAMHGQYPWMLKTEDITLYVSRGQFNGIASVRFNARFLWSCQSILEAIIKVQELLDDLFQDDIYLQASAVDLCVDVAGWDDIHTLDRAKNFVSRSRKRKLHSEPDWIYDQTLQEHSYGMQETGFDFSKHGPISCTIYDKSRELVRSGKEWFYDLWRAHGWSEDEGGKVWRVEFKYKREALHELQQGTLFHGIEDAYELLDRLGLLWSYAAGHVNGGEDGLPDGWLRCVVSNGDKNRSRWPAHPAWKVVQSAFQKEMPIPEQFGKVVRKRWEDHNIDKGIEAVIGYLSSLAAWSGGELAEEGVDLSMVLHWLAQEGQEYLERVDRDFSAEVLRKRMRIGASK